MSNSKKIAELKSEIEILEAKDKAFMEMPKDEQLASIMHSMLCTHDHTEQCGWYYEIRSNKPDWTGHAHARYLNKARKVIQTSKEQDVSADVAIEIIKAIGK